jgi:hypothetical protein
MSPRAAAEAIDATTAARLHREVRAAEVALAEATERRDDAVRALLAQGFSAPALASSLGLTRSRVYQIRDGRR